MNDYIPFRNGKCYTHSDSGFSGAFSWWRNSLNPTFWSVMGYGEFSIDGLAVTDDFGTLVRVPA